MRARVPSIAILSLVTVISTVIIYRPASVVNSANVEPNAPHVLPTPTAKSEGTTKNGVTLVSEWDGEKLVRPDADWKGFLTEIEYYVLREKGTEQPYSGKLTDNKQVGTFHCAAGGLALFSSKHKLIRSPAGRAFRRSRGIILRSWKISRSRLRFGPK